MLDLKLSTLSRLFLDPRALGMALGALMLVLPTAGCKNKNYPQCKKDKHCKVDLGEKCVDGSCQNCKVDADCVGKAPAGAAAFVCHDFRCMDPAEAAKDGAGGGGTGEMGSPCTQTIDCVGGLVCNAGACAGCTDDIECAPSTCTLETGRCSAAGQCTTDDQCPMDQICDGGMCIFAGGGTTGGGPCGLDAVYFGFDADNLTPKTQEDLTGVASCIAEQGVEVILEAHADAVGTEEYNIMLTERRGGSVRSFLVEKGVPAELLRVLAKGSLESTGTTEADRAKERRVQLIWP